jgi:hypothetical protein
LVAESSVEEVMVRGLAVVAIVKATDFVWDGELLSLTVAVKLDVPLEEGVPEIVPVVAVIERPAGSCPDVMDQV